MKTSKDLETAVNSYKTGNEESFINIYNLSYSYLYVCIRHMVKDNDTADDMLQETYLEICKSIHQLENTENFLKWAAMIANRKCIAYLKKNGRIMLTEGNEEEREDFFERIPDNEAFIPEEIMQDQEKIRLMREIIDGLSDMQRICVIGYYYNEQKQEEIAEELGVPVNTVKSHLSRAKVKIKEGVLELEEKKGTRLYTLAPFMLLFLAKEVEACEAAPMSEGLSEALKEGNANHGKAGKAGSAVKEPLKFGIKLKLIVAAAVVAGIAIAGAVVLLGKNSGENSRETQETTGEQETAEPTKDTENIFDDEESSQVEEAAAQEQETTEEESALAISGIYEQLGGGRFGVIPAEKNGKYGLVTYDNEVLVPFEYDYYSYAPNDDGQTFFGNEGDYRVFDKEGNEIFRTDKPIKAVSEGVVLWFEEDEETYESAYGYVKLDGTVLYDSSEQSYPPVFGQCGAVGFNEGYAIFNGEMEDYRMDQAGNRLDLFAEREILRHPEMLAPTPENPMFEVNAAGEDFNLLFPIGACYQGYYVNRGPKIFIDVHDYFEINDIEGKETYYFHIEQLVDYLGYSYWEEPNLSWSVCRFFYNGNYCYSNGTIMSVKLDRDGEVSYYLLDLNRLEVIINEYWSTTVNVTEDTILASKDYIDIGPSTYWLFSEDGRWGYMDHSGNVIGIFDDACTFYTGKAMVVKDGNAYFIDEDMNLSEWNIPAESVTNHLEIVSVKTEDGEKCYSLMK